MVDSTGSATGAITALGTGSSASSLNSVNFDTFLKLLVTQLKNQDPLNPMDGTQFTSQIAQFSTLEQQINSNNYLQTLVAQRDFGQQTLAASYIGKDVLGAGDDMVKQGDTVNFGYSLEDTANKVEVDVYDSTGKLVQTIKGDPTKGSHMLTWDGKDDNGNVMPDGTYTVKVSAEDKDGKVVKSSALTFGTVASALNDGSTTSVLLTDGRQIAVSDILAVQNAKATTTASAE